MGVEVKACGDMRVVRVVVVFACAETGQVKSWPIFLHLSMKGSKISEWYNAEFPFAWGDVCLAEWSIRIRCPSTQHTCWDVLESSHPL